MNPHPFEWIAQDNRRKILEFIRRYQGDHEYSPSQAEIAAGTRLSINTVRSHMQQLVHEGRLQTGPGPRMIRIIEKEGEG